jgi:hypothetical protein
MDSDRELVGLVVGISRLGYRGSIRERALSALTAWAKDRGTDEVLRWIREDPGLLVLPSYPFLLRW